MMLDQKLYKLPLFGWVVQRLYGYFRKHIAFTDFIHVAPGFGMGILAAGGELRWLGFMAVGLGLLGHLFALVRGK